MAAPSKTTVRNKLERSRLDKKAVQQELMSKELDIDKLLIYLQSKIKFDAAKLVTAMKVSRTIDGASTLTIEISDYNRRVLQSGVLTSKLDVEIDGLWFRMVKFEKAEMSDKLTLTFEDREVAILRTYSKFKIASRARATRAEFVKNLINEVKEFKIPTVIPQLRVVQPIEVKDEEPTEFEIVVGKSSGINPDLGSVAGESGFSVLGESIKSRTGGQVAFQPGVTDFPTATSLAGARLTVKGAKATTTQINNANTILRVGQSMGVDRKVLVCAIMTAITESQLINNPGGDLDSAGLFQQRPSWGSYRDRTDPATSARLFYLQAIKVHAIDRTRPYWDLCAVVQRPREDLRTAYEDWRTEAERFVVAYGVPGGDRESSAAVANSSWSPDSESGEYFFYRGDPSSGGKKWKPENSWKCIQRLADEVEWRAFMVSGTFYFITEDDLFKSKPIMVVSEFDEGVEGLGIDYDHNKKSASIRLTVRIGRWQAPPGSIVVIRGAGPANGRWLVHEFERDLLQDSRATIVLKKPRPKLPEPSEQTLDDGTSWGGNTSGVEQHPVAVGAYGSPLPYPIDRSMVISTPEQHALRAFGNWQSDQAYDIKADPGTPVFAVASGTITKVALHNVFLHEGAVFGAQISIKADDGNSWWVTHIERVPDNIREGAKVFKGQQLGTVTLWSTNPAGSHVHYACDERLALESLFIP